MGQPYGIQLTRSGLARSRMGSHAAAQMGGRRCPRRSRAQPDCGSTAPSSARGHQSPGPSRGTFLEGLGGASLERPFGGPSEGSTKSTRSASQDRLVGAPSLASRASREARERVRPEARPGGPMVLVEATFQKRPFRGPSIWALDLGPSVGTLLPLGPFFLVRDLGLFLSRNLGPSSRPVARTLHRQSATRGARPSLPSSGSGNSDAFADPVARRPSPSSGFGPSR